MKIRRSLHAGAAAMFALSLAGAATAQSIEPIEPSEPSEPSEPIEPIPVVATFSILGDMVERIGGERVAVTTLVGPDGDTHVYAPTPADARAVSDAQVIVANGLGFEGWLDRLVDAAGFDGAHVMVTRGIEPIAYQEGEQHDDG